MVNYSNCTKNELISVCKSKNIKNVYNKKKEELIKILKKGGNNDEFKSFEKLLLILYGIKSNDINYLDLNLDYKELNYLQLIRFILNKGKITEEIKKKINNVKDKEVGIFIYSITNIIINNKSKNNNINNRFLINEGNKIEISEKFKNIEDRKSVV